MRPEPLASWRLTAVPIVVATLAGAAVLVTQGASVAADPMVPTAAPAVQATTSAYPAPQIDPSAPPVEPAPTF
jgi:hypothetical protein